MLLPIKGTASAWEQAGGGATLSASRERALSEVNTGVTGDGGGDQTPGCPGTRGPANRNLLPGSAHVRGVLPLSGPQFPPLEK